MNFMASSLVIGGTLFLGRALVRRLLSRGDQVTILHREKTTPFGDSVRSIQCDRNDISLVIKTLTGSNFEVVYDNVYDWQRGTTAEQVIAAAQSCKSLKRYVFTSSVAAYCHGDAREVDESGPLVSSSHPDSYARNKAESERSLFKLHAESGFPVVTLRPPYIYGPENPFYRESFFWDRLLAFQPIIIPGDGSRLMQFIHADDFARAAILATESDKAVGRSYNIAHPTAVTQEELVHTLARVAGVEPKLVFIDRETLIEKGGKVFEPPYYFAQYFDMPPILQKTERARSELGFDARDFEKGLTDSFFWYRRQSRRQAPDFSWENDLLVSLDRG